MSDKIHYVYKVTNKVNGKIYIGVHYGYPNDPYLGSGTMIKQAVSKYGRENFTKEVLLETVTSEEAYEVEALLVDEEFIQREDVYNLTVGGFGNLEFGKISMVHPNTQSLTVYGIHYPSMAECTRQTKLNTVKIWYLCGDPSTPDCFFDNQERQELAKEQYKDYQVRLQRKHDTLSRLAHERFFGKKVVMTEEHKRHISEATKSSKKFQDRLQTWNRSEDKIKKTAEKHRGMKRSEETKRRMSEAKKGKKTHTFDCYMAYDENEKRHYLKRGSELPKGWRWSERALKLMQKS